MTTASDICVAFIGLGQLGFSLAKGIAGRGDARVVGIDPYLSLDRKEAAQKAGIDLQDADSGLGDAAFVFSTVQPQHSLAAAELACTRIQTSAVFLDLNSMGRDEKIRNSEVLVAAQRHFIDGAVLGPAQDGIRVPIVLSGIDADRISQQINALGLNTRCVGDSPGQASAIKIVRSVLAKGLEALYVEALVAAQRFDIRDEVLNSFCQMLDARPAKEMAELLVTTHVVHAERRLHEIGMSASAIASAGIEPSMARAACDVFRRSVEAGVPAAAANVVPTSLEAALDILARRL
ncbi:NAD(P)-dependent oxidoreductase [Allopusillimonas ginsengisoli]|uniref:NAD(P)-dependent oxidoreductase n=1 Tax=Allopusillimonas ginsengisoli TaxID=453575 RepID=UPI00101F2CDB|nr:DUF1932 domain-containing protein [Allopusillimonas ginsengisoli]TEA79045.1 NAD(P)-dependent oxidoreductase [Allopusillimonas ginsengisoli]